MSTASKNFVVEFNGNKSGGTSRLMVYSGVWGIACVLYGLIRLVGL